MHAGKLGQITNFRSAIVGGTAKHCIDQYMVLFLFRHCLLDGNTVMPGELHARLCHAFLVLNAVTRSRNHGSAAVRGRFLDLSQQQRSVLSTENIDIQMITSTLLTSILSLLLLYNAMLYILCELQWTVCSRFKFLQATVASYDR